MQSTTTTTTTWTDYLVLSAFFLSYALILVSRYPSRCVGTKPRPDLPGPVGVPLVGNMFQLFAQSARMIGYLGDLEQRYGPVFTFTMPYWGRNIVVNRPEWLDHVRKRDTTVYVKGDVVRDVFSQFPGPKTPPATDGADWRSARKMMSPVFSANSVNNHALHAMEDIVPLVQGLLGAASKLSRPIEWNDLSGRIALAIFCKMAFNASMNTLTSELSCLDRPNEIRLALWTLNRISADRMFNPAWRLTEFFNGDRALFHQAKSQLMTVIENLIEERKPTANLDNNGGGGDYLSSLLSDIDNKDISAIKDILMTLLLAGSDSTQNTISWAMYELTRQPQWIVRMRNELPYDASGGFKVPSVSELENYPVHLAVFYETIRLWPGLPKNGRMASSDDLLPAIPTDNLPAVPVSKGDFILWSDMSMMRNIAVWGPDAKEFNPARHLDVNGKWIRPATPRFHGFGAGPRACPAKQLATYEFVTIMGGILGKYDFTPVKPGVRGMVDAFTPFMDGPFYLTVSERIN